MIQTFTKIQDWNQHRKEQVKGSLGFVPTMGALHDGHVSLVERSLAENDRTLVSIYVNPTQFSDPKDLEKYPIDLEEDVERLNEVGAHYLIIPTYEQIYTQNYRYRVSEVELSRKLCGAFRPGHFEGVLTIVMKLLNIAKADKAYFGEKDYQQFQLIKGLTAAFFMDTDIIGVPTVRESDGLAMSSRNRLLSDKQRELAPQLHRIISESKSTHEAEAELKKSGFLVDYVEDIDGRRYAAAFLGNVRLIDNVSV